MSPRQRCQGRRSKERSPDVAQITRCSKIALEASCSADSGMDTPLTIPGTGDVWRRSSFDLNSDEITLELPECARSSSLDEMPPTVSTTESAGEQLGEQNDHGNDGGETEATDGTASGSPAFYVRRPRISCRCKRPSTASNIGGNSTTSPSMAAPE